MADEEQQAQQDDAIPQYEDNTEEQQGGEGQEEPALASLSKTELDKAAQELANDGQFSQETIDSLTNAGYSQEEIEQYALELTPATAEDNQAEQEFYKALGGKELVDKALAWSADNLSKIRVDQLNRRISAESTREEQLKAMQEIMATYHAAQAGQNVLGQKGPPMIRGKQNSRQEAVKTYSSAEAFLKEVGIQQFGGKQEDAQRFESDVDFKRQVIGRLVATQQKYGNQARRLPR